MNTALATTLPAHEIGMHGERKMMVYTTLNPTNERDKILLASCMLSYVSIKDTEGKPTPVINYLEWDDIDTDEATGEVSLLHKCGFVTQEGQVLFTTGASFPAKMALYLRMFGPPPWNPAKWFVFGEDIAKKSGRIYHWFRPINAPVIDA
jgi:hypothetical protein